jgi:hypothetical protein
VLCRIYKWKLSGAIDSGKPLSGTVKRHLLRCASCRESAGLAEETGRRLTRDAGVLLESVDRSLAKRVQASLGDQLESPASHPGASLRLRPILTAAAALVVVGASVLWVVRSRPQRMPALTPPFQIEKPGAYLEAAVEKVGFPYEKEIRRWKDAFDSTAKTLKACFDIGLGEGKK